MRRAAILFAAVLLSGCTAAPDPTSTPDVNPNEAACDDFVSVTEELADRVVNDDFDPDTDHAYFMGRFDEVALAAEGDVEDRVERLIANLPEPVWMLFLDSDTYFEDSRSVARACAADGFEISPVGWQ